MAPSSSSSAAHTSNATRETNAAARAVSPLAFPATTAAVIAAISSALGNWKIGNRRGMLAASA